MWTSVPASSMAVTTMQVAITQTALTHANAKRDSIAVSIINVVWFFFNSFFRSFTDNDLCDPLKRRRRWSLIKCAFKINTYLNHCNSDRYFIIRSKSWQREILILCKHTFPLPNEHWNNLKSTKSRSYELHLMGLGFYQGNDQELNKTSFP